MGPQFGHLGGRPRKPRVGAILAEEARRRADEIVDALAAGMAKDQPAEQRGRAAERWARLAHREGELQRREEEVDVRRPDLPDYASMDRAELVSSLARVLARRTQDGSLPDPRELLPGAVEGSAVDSSDAAD